jgi:uncharacterized repeat protein (TIGR01451 family)
MRYSLFAALLLGLSLVTGSAYAQGTVELKHIAEVETQVKTPDGKIEKKRGPVEKAIPGTEVIYTSIFKNTGAKPAAKISIKNAIPVGTTLVAGSPWGEGADITYSADGGKTWAAVDKIKIKDAATGKERPAALTELTHIRWSLRGDLAPSAQGEVGYRVVVN